MEQVENLKSAYMALTWTNEDGKNKRELLHARIHKLHLDCPDGLDCSIFQADQAARLTDMRQQGQEALRQWSNQMLTSAIQNTMLGQIPNTLPPTSYPTPANPIFTAAAGQYQGVAFRDPTAQQAYAGMNALQSFKPPINYTPGVAYEIPQGQLGTVTYETETSANSAPNWAQKLFEKMNPK